MTRSIKSLRNFREILREEFEFRRSLNSKYSLRSFARDVGVSASRLSEVLAGRYGLSGLAAKSICKNLGYTKDETEYFVSLVESKHARSKLQKIEAQEKLENFSKNPKFQRVGRDVFSMISDWYHCAIIELTRCQNFKSNSQWIAAELGISEKSANEALDRLIRLKFLNKKNGKITSNEDFNEAPTGIPSTAVRKFHRQILNKAAQSLEAQKIEERENSTLVIAVRKEQLVEAKKKIDDFTTEFAKQFGEGSSKKDSVYCLTTHFFNLNKESK